MIETVETTGRRRRGDIRTREELRTYDFDALLDRYTPLIRRLAERNVGEEDREGIQQELSLVLWRCYERFDPAAHPGKGGRIAGFTTYYWGCCERELRKIHARALRGMVVAVLRCSGCDAERVPGTPDRTICPECGGRAWRAERGGRPSSLEGMMESAGEDEPLDALLVLADEDPTEGLVSGMAIRQTLAELSPAARAAVAFSLEGLPLNGDEREVLRRVGPIVLDRLTG